MDELLTSRANGARVLAVILSLMLAGCSPSGESASGAQPSPSSSSVPTDRPSAAALPSPIERAATVVASIPLDAHGTRVAVNDGSAWARLADGSVVRVDTTTNSVVARIPVGSGEFGSLAVGEGAAWVTTFDKDTVSRIDPATNKVLAAIPVGTNPEGVAVTPGAVWVSNHRAGSISRIDPATNKAVATITFGKTAPSGPKDIAISHGSLWTSVPNMGLVVRIDPAANKVVATIKVLGTDGLVIGDEAVYSYGFGGQLYEIDAATNEVSRKFTPDQAPWMFARGSYWGSVGPDHPATCSRHVRPDRTLADRRATNRLRGSGLRRRVGLAADRRWVSATSRTAVATPCPPTPRSSSGRSA